MNSIKKTSVSLFLFSSLLLVSCGGNPVQENAVKTAEEAPTEHPTTFEVKAIGNSMADMQFDRDEIRVNAGKEITITLVNEGIDEAMIHNLAIVVYGYAQEVSQKGFNHKDNSYTKPGDPAVIAVSPLANPGETTSVKFTIEEKGSYQFVCTYPGHWGRMLGTLLVE
jgi:azurin